MRRLVVVLSLVVAACGSGLPQMPDRTVDLFESGIESAPEWSAGDLITVGNSGRFGHTLVITAHDGSVVYASDLIESGESVSLAVPLAPGTYELSCRIVGLDDDGRVLDHYERGMHTTVRIAG